MTRVDTAEAVSEHVPLKRWLAVVAVAVGTFLVVTAEQLPVGLLTSIGGDLGVSEGTAGLMVTVPGLVASAGALLVPVAIGRRDRRSVLLGLIGLMVAANLLSFAAPNFPVLLASRFLVGISIGGFWALAAGIAVRLVPSGHVPRATSIAFGGATAANVLGVPAGTLIGGLTDWRVAFLILSGLGLLALAALFLLLPGIPATGSIRLRPLLALFGNPFVRGATIATFLLVGGHTAAYTFVSPVLQDVSGVDENLIGPFLLVFGAAGVVGTFLAGTAAGRNVRATIAAVTVLLTAVLALFPLLGTVAVSGVALLVLWGLAFGGVPVTVQMWILKAAPDHAEAATALNTVVFNLAIALGALFGGFVVNGASTTAVLWFGAVLTVLTFAAMWRTRRP
ncbi:putative MFS family arabinose efflux permease [Actinomadura pelletieri DSM 43383]|uniref:Putative MFS family arabinose efflux permease n=1 Tax=Actinomadura pelletieri DSM 43383 TaxID=1120940 RepID=A0A495QYS6_9ACTN|nr:MFS transporter [Actinomadura pelletieri]RKS79076.1 putative MFS family arabinose efflux permease [Actinomadura pelletieri DSM 43383]